MGFTNIEPIAGNFDVQLPELTKRLALLILPLLMATTMAERSPKFNRMLPSVADTSVW
jgi:hypothetical protein